MTEQRPPEYTDGWGELIRAHRYTIGVSQRTMAQKMGITERSLSDIEVGRRACPPGFLDSVEDVLTEFDKDVDLAVEAAETVLGKNHLDGRVDFHVRQEPEGEWKRVVVGRAAVESGKIMPVLVYE